MTPKRFSWYVCHNCGKEYRIADGIRASNGCDNCYFGDIHVHSNADGELPKTLGTPTACQGASDPSWVWK